MNRGNTALIAIIVVIAIGGTLFAVFQSQKAPESDVMMEEVMEEKEGGSMEKHDGDSMMMEKKDGESMMKEDEGVMEPFDAAQDDSHESEDGKMMMEAGEPLSFDGKVLAGNSSPLIDFNQADYEKALESDKLVVLYFYANWCPTCKQEVSNGLNPAFNSLEGDDVVGFRVSYNDNQTDSNEKDLAKEFGVAYQHTKVFVKGGERILKSPESWSKSRYLSEINNNKN